MEKLIDTHTLVVFENGELRRIHGPQGEETTELREN